LVENKGQYNKKLNRGKRKSCTLEDEPERGYEIETKTSLKG